MGKMFFKFPTIAMFKYHKRQKKEKDTMKSKWKNANNRETRLVTSRIKAKVKLFTLN